MRTLAMERLMQSLVVILCVTVVAFLMMHYAPGQPLQVNPELRPDPTAVERWLVQHGLDRPLPGQYLFWLSRVLCGDFGVSLLHNRPVLQMLAERLPATLLLSAVSMLLALFFAVPLGIRSAAGAGSLADRTVGLIALAGISVPPFWLGLMLVLLFSHSLRWLPSSGMATPGGGGIGNLLSHLILPAVVLAVGNFSYFVRYVRNAVLEVLERDYIRTARAKGLSERQVFMRHVLPNSVIPLVMVLALSLPQLFTGAAVVEHVFAWPGMGRLIILATMSRDYPVVMAVTLLSAVVVAVSNLCADLLYLLLDPRVREKRK